MGEGKSQIEGKTGASLGTTTSLRTVAWPSPGNTDRDIQPRAGALLSKSGGVEAIYTLLELKYARVGGGPRGKIVVL